jgi:DNA-binding MarR family transcriptional regulator
MSINNLAAELSIDPTTVTRQVAVMFSAGFVTRVVDPDDGRVRLITLSKTGRAQMDAIQRIRRDRSAKSARELE